MSNFQRMVPPERRAVFVQGTGATVAGTVNTNIIAFTGTPTNWQIGALGTAPYPVGTTFVAPTEGSGNWLNIVNSASAGSGFKFNRRGVYQIDLYGEGTSADTGAAQLAVTIDQGAGLDTVAAGTVSALSQSVLGWQNKQGVAATIISAHVSVPLYITETLAGGAQPSADLTTTRGVGVVRFLANNAGNAVVAPAVVVTSIRATIVQQFDGLGG